MKRFISLLAAFALAATPALALANIHPLAPELKQERAATLSNKKQERASTTEARKQENVEKRLEKQNDLLAKAKERADREIARRLTRLETLSDRIIAMKRLSEADKTSLEALLSAERTKLAALRAQIAADTGTTTLRTSIGSIGKSYRIFALVMPRASITAAADRVLSVATQLEQVSAKLSARITALKTAGTDTASLDALLADMNAKISEAKRLVLSAIDQVSMLVPDEGDKAKMEANLAALRAAHAKVKEAHAALKDAHKDAKKLTIGIKDSGRVETNEGTTGTP